MDRILIILKKENGPRASSAPALGLNTIIFKHVYWYMQQTQVSVYRTIGPLVFNIFTEFCNKFDLKWDIWYYVHKEKINSQEKKHKVQSSGHLNCLQKWPPTAFTFQFVLLAM